ncbi:Xenin [Arthrobotrys entomopaga]|nr:Xenin [Arthrobotrys entomopaga]
MKTDFNFSNLLGTVYCKGNLVFTPDGASLLSPVGNRVSYFDLANNKSFTFSFAHRKNVTRIALSPQATLLLSVDEDGRAILTNFVRRTPLYNFNFKSKVYDLQFAPDGRHFAVATGRTIEVWRTPEFSQDREFAPFVRHRVYTGHFDVVNSITWSSDSRFFLTASKDLTSRIWSLDPTEGFVPTTLGGHKESVIGTYFSADQETLYSLSKDGALFTWKYTGPWKDDNEMDDEEEEVDPSQERWRVVKRNYFMQGSASVKCATYHATSDLLVVGFSSGIFSLYEMPDFNLIHTLSISQKEIDFVTINKSGDWLAFAASKLGQLLVWEWQSESYILKQQGHFDSINALIYTPDGQRVITTADDGKVKIWDITSGFCVATFTEHTSGVTACAFAKRGNVLFTASLDGSIRAWDLLRYRNFRTFTAPSRLQFTSLAIDPSGEVVCAGSLDSFDVHLWSVQTGQLLDSLAGHEGPVSSLSFASDGSSLVSGSWDHTVRIWSIFGRTQLSEPLHMKSDVLSVAFRPDGRQIAACTLDGEVNFWSVEDAAQTGHVDGTRDVSGGRRISDRRTAASSAAGKNFNTITYSADGACVLVGGNSKYIVLYDVDTGSLLKKFSVSINLSIDGTQEMLNSKNMTEAGPVDLIDEQGEASDLEDRIDRSLPGATRGDASVRGVRPQIRVTSVAFSPTGRSFAAASTEGLLIYSLDNYYTFDPFDLEIDITPASILGTLKRKEYLKALVMSFRLNEKYLIHQVYESIPVADIKLVVKELPVVYLSRLLTFIAKISEESPHLEFHLLWFEAVLSLHGRYLRGQAGRFGSELRMVQKCVVGIQTELARLADENIYTLDYLLSKPKQGKQQNNTRLLMTSEGMESEGSEDGGDVEMNGESPEEGSGWGGFSESDDE